MGTVILKSLKFFPPKSADVRNPHLKNSLVHKTPAQDNPLRLRTSFMDYLTVVNILKFITEQDHVEA